MKKNLLFIVAFFFVINFSYSQVKLGDKLEGGIVYFIDATGKHGLIADVKDLKKMNWNKAKKACEEKGDGWHLPTKEELDKLYQQRDLIGGFDNFYYWSSTLDKNDNPWGQNFANGIPEVSRVKVISVCVRAVKSF
jgi:hypothetical protein